MKTTFALMGIFLSLNVSAQSSEDKEWCKKYEGSFASGYGDPKHPGYVFKETDELYYTSAKLKIPYHETMKTRDAYMASNKVDSCRDAKDGQAQSLCEAVNTYEKAYSKSKNSYCHSLSEREKAFTADLNLMRRHGCNTSNLPQRVKAKLDSYKPLDKPMFFDGHPEPDCPAPGINAVQMSDNTRKVLMACALAVRFLCVSDKSGAIPPQTSVPIISRQR